jgi:hypothetical protein
MSRPRGGRIWLPKIVAALQQLGGESNLTDLYAQIEKAHMGPLANTWKSTVRQTLQMHDPDSRYYYGNSAVFYHKGRGRWALR